ncbi:DUF3800 domain-containing protein [Rathayibacter toxicus]|nr:DUF3800 domain-containing protein [Rathayibacter toxicus]PPG46034.1 DUF3800 domain-containing protein [Rathayibacter toxicus]PPH63066.1 DUF3800 domain-containing protein [Rathayibacter toxicus]PPH67222.1 DUF3800 domain-containing protein [Rathayibacter toxicus]PPH72001.1 DUF3800 domain-containing protein [Rathayibacter toxicus]
MDESYSQDFYFIGAAVTTQEKWEQLEQGYYVLREQIAADHGVPSNVEFHGHELMGGAGEWSPLRGKHREATGIYAAALRIAQEADVRYLFRGVDVKRLNARYRYPDQPHKVVLQHLLERVNDYRRDLLPVRHGGRDCRRRRDRHPGGTSESVRKLPLVGHARLPIESARPDLVTHPVRVLEEHSRFAGGRPRGLPTPATGPGGLKQLRPHRSEVLGWQRSGNRPVVNDTLHADPGRGPITHRLRNVHDIAL